MYGIFNQTKILSIETLFMISMTPVGRNLIHYSLPGFSPFQGKTRYTIVYRGSPRSKEKPDTL